jgi:hypothetical protein
MKYEYKVVTLCGWDESLQRSDMEKLNTWFEKGWEYAETLQQRISTGSSSARYPAVGVILRKEKQTDPLN